MSSSSHPASRVSLEELIALNDELVNLIRLGIPLETGLAQFGKDHQGAIAKIAARISAELSQGSSLQQALNQRELGLPRIYTAIVEAGMTCGRLTAALESMSEYARRLRVVRSEIGLGILYPLIVFLFAWGLFVSVLLPFFVDSLEPAFIDASLQPPALLRFLVDSSEFFQQWAFVPPAALLGLALIWPFTGRASLLQFRGFSRPLGWLPRLPKLCRDFRVANFCQILSMMIQHRVPLSSALLLSAEATVTSPMQHDIENCLASIQTGTRLPESDFNPRGLPPYLRWVLTQNSGHEQFSSALQSAGEYYRQRATHQLHWLKKTFPTIALVTIGGSICFLYLLTFTLPMKAFIQQLSGL